ncbi:MAG: hypothetical protein VYD87_01690 [Pseudomonadota bacterium]|nr:hypothetical protein [Pseudomonadota bacterium]
MFALDLIQTLFPAARALLSPILSARETAAEIARIETLDDDALVLLGQDRQTLVARAVDRYLAR